MQRNAKIYVAGSDTFIGEGIVQGLTRQGYTNIVGRDGKEPELTLAHEVDKFFAVHSPEYVFVAAGKIGGIGANQKYPAALMLDNLLVSSNIINSAYRHSVKKLLYLGSSCSYPKHCPQPMQEASLLSAPLEPTSEFYSVSKIAGMKLCQAFRRQYGMNFISAIPANPFGPGDDFDPDNAHVIGALMRKMSQAKAAGLESVTIWGTGKPRREFIYSSDLADACIFVMDQYSDDQPINLGSGSETTIQGLANAIKQIVGYSGELVFDDTKPDGMPLKVLDSAKLFALGWRPKTSLSSGLLETYAWFLRNEANSVSCGTSPQKGAVADVR